MKKKKKISIAFFSLDACVKKFYLDVSQTFFSVPHLKLDREWPSSILMDFLWLFTASWRHIKKSYPCLVCGHFDLYFMPGMADFATAALLRRIEDA